MLSNAQHSNAHSNAFAFVNTPCFSVTLEIAIAAHSADIKLWKIISQNSIFTVV